MVNIGAMWEVWSGGLYATTLHRVVHRSPSYRVSVPFFTEPNFDARRKGVEEGREVEEGGETVYGEYLLEKVGGNFKI